MLRSASYDIVFQEIPDEVTLALNISGCPNRCKGCHSPHLQEDLGEFLTDSLLSGLLNTYGNSITCVCFMGGDREPEEVIRLASYIKSINNDLKIGWYSGRNNLPEYFTTDYFEYIKLGPYIEELGGLKSKTTNQRLYKVVNGQLKNIAL